MSLQLFFANSAGKEKKITARWISLPLAKLSSTNHSLTKKNKKKISLDVWRKNYETFDRKFTYVRRKGGAKKIQPIFTKDLNRPFLEGRAFKNHECSEIFEVWLDP
jgi:hypothetical protein